VVPFGLKIPVDSAVVLPCGGLCVAVEAVTDFELRGKVVDDQQRDPESGLRLWQVTIADLEQPEPGRYLRSSIEMRVRIAAEVAPVPPEPTVPGLPPLVAFEGLTLSPYVDAQRCGPGNREVRCRGRLAYSLRATRMVPFHPQAVPAAKPKAA
jgi:hypothetical protein